MGAADWQGYLHDFHDQHPGITADVLDHAEHEGLNPYQWLVEALPRSGPVLDVACGSGPLAAALAEQGWFGLDLSAAELAAAAGNGAGPVIRANATSLPLAESSVEAVVCSMALMLVQPVENALAEVARVLRPGGTLVALLPSNRPLTSPDAYRYARLLAVLGHRSLRYPNEGVLEDVGGMLGCFGLRLVSDERRRFRCHITSPTVGVMCVRSLYLPGVPADRLAAGEALAARWVGKHLGLPLRRVVALRRAAPGHGHHHPGVGG